MTDCHYFLLCKKNVSWHILAPGARSLATIFIFSRWLQDICIIR